jgi:hypothetical protein
MWQDANNSIIQGLMSFHSHTTQGLKCYLSKHFTEPEFMHNGSKRTNDATDLTKTRSSAGGSYHTIFTTHATVYSTVKDELYH